MEKRMSIAVNAKLKKLASLTGASQQDIDQIVGGGSDSKVNAFT
jgi:hypothetical protein